MRDYQLEKGILVTALKNYAEGRHLMFRKGETVTIYPSSNNRGMLGNLMLYAINLQPEFHLVKDGYISFKETYVRL